MFGMKLPRKCDQISIHINEYYQNINYNLFLLLSYIKLYGRTLLNGVRHKYFPFMDKIF